jgi:hypothetical protein
MMSRNGPGAYAKLLLEWAGLEPVKPLTRGVG